MRSCFLFGHRDAPCRVQDVLVETVKRHYQQENVRCFYVGGYGTFDAMAAAAVMEVRKLYGDILLYLVIPYHPAERPVSTPQGFEGTYYPPLNNVPRRYAIVKANRYMVDVCDTLICYVRRGGNAGNLLAYATRKRKTGSLLENIADAQEMRNHHGVDKDKKRHLPTED